MKVKNRKAPKIEDIYLNKPKVVGNKVYYSWSENPILDENVLWIEYPDLTELTAASNELMAPYLPICLVFAVLGKVNVHLPYKVSDELLEQWVDLITKTANVLYRKTTGFVLVNGSMPVELQQWQGNNTGVLFGGGSEALLTLAQEMDNNKPAIISFGGPRWGGSDPEKNITKFKMDQVVANDFNLNVINIRTSFFQLIYEPDWDWRIYFRHNIQGMISSSVLLPFFYTALLPIAGQLGLARVISGNENEYNTLATGYTFSDRMVASIQNLSYGVDYESHLNKLTKPEIIERLHITYPNFGKHQYSCLSNENERWCCACEKCFRITILMKCYGVNPATVDLNEAKIIINKNKIKKILRSSVARGTLALEYKNMEKKIIAQDNQDVTELFYQFYDSGPKMYAVKAKITILILFKKIKDNIWLLKNRMLDLIYFS